MNKYIKILVFLFLIALSFDAFSQNDNFYKTWELRQLAQNAELKNDYVLALEYCKKISKRKPKDIEVKYKVASLMFKVRDYENAKNLFLEVYTAKPKKYSDALFYYAETCRYLGEYIEAESRFDEFIANNEKDEKSELIYLSKLALKGIDLTKDTAFYHHYNIIHLNISINTPHLESSPIFYTDSTFIYSSYNIDTVKIILDSAVDIYSRFYLAEYHNGQWTGKLNPPEPFFNLPEHSTANGAFSIDKKRFYFTVRERNSRGYEVSQLYFTEKINGAWTIPVKLQNKINLPFYNSTQPTVGYTYDKNFEIIYFVSDRPEGWGGKDIWFTVYDLIHRTFSEPVNAGGYINTIGDEITPFYETKTKTMFFSSNGLPGFGGFDVFKTIGGLSKWIPAENLGSPINSSFDDVYFVKKQNATEGFFVSNRTEALDWGNENCCFDIFRFDTLKINRIVITGQLVTPSKSIYNSINNIINNIDTMPDTTTHYIANTVVDLNIRNNNDSTYMSIFKDTTDYEGRFLFSVETGHDFSFTINSEDYMFSTCDFSTDSLTKDTVNFDCITAEPIKDHNIVLDNILFEFNSANLTDSSKKYIDSVIVPILKYYDNIIVEIGAHTDKIGSFDYNMKLSQERAETVVNRIVAAGVGVNRIIAKGYGETHPRMCETYADGRDNSYSRKMNRRVEFKILGFVK